MGKNGSGDCGSGRVFCTTLKKAIKLGFVEREEDGSFNLRQVRRGIEAQSAPRGGQKWGNSGGMSAQLVSIKAEQAKEELELTRGWAELMMNFRDAILTVGDQVALRCDGKRGREIAAIIREAHESILQELGDGGGRVNIAVGLKGDTR